MKLPEPFCLRTQELNSLLLEGRADEARDRAIDLLYAGYKSQPFFDFVAEMLKPKRQGKGKPKSWPRNWYEIAVAYEELIDRGESELEAKHVIAVQFGCGATTVKRAVALYREGKAASE